MRRGGEEKLAQIRDNRKLLNFLLETLPTLSDFVQDIVNNLPNDLDKMDINKINEIRPLVREMIKFTHENINVVSGFLDEIDEETQISQEQIKELKKVHKMYQQAISDILRGVESLYLYLLEEEGATEKNIYVFIEKLFDGSVGILKLVDEITS